MLILRKIRLNIFDLQIYRLYGYSNAYAFFFADEVTRNRLESSEIT